MSLRARIALFLAVLMADALIVTAQPWAMAVGVAAYLIILFPVLRNPHD